MLVVVLSGPGGAGKGTVAQALVEGGDLVLSRSWTTRARRVDDAEDAYVFVTKDEFEAHRDAGGFLEWNEFLGEFYGTPVPSGDRDLLLEIDVAGGRQVLARQPDALCLFLDAPDDEELRRRLLGRGDSLGRADQRVAFFALPLFSGPNPLFAPADGSSEGVPEALAVLLDGLDFPTSATLALR